MILENRPAPELFQKVFRAGDSVGLFDLSCPLQRKGSGLRAALTAHDRPINTRQINVAQGLEQRFEADEAHRGRRGLQMGSLRASSRLFSIVVPNQTCE